MNEYFSFCNVLYKITDEPGWLYGKFNGDRDTVLTKCRKFDWLEFLIFEGGECCFLVKDTYPCSIDPYYLHLTTDWVYLKEFNKIFLPNELIPLPSSPCSISDKFDITSRFQAEDNKIEDIYTMCLEDDCSNQDLICSFPYISYRFNQAKLTTLVELSNSVINDFRKLIKDIERSQFSCLTFQEHNFIKILCWPLNTTCRIKIQSYDKHDVLYEPIDCFVDTKDFLVILRTFICNISKKHDKYVSRVIKMIKNQKGERVYDG